MIFLFIILISLGVQAQEMTYNQAQFKASHNSYAKKISIWDQLTLHKLMLLNLIFIQQNF